MMKDYELILLPMSKEMLEEIVRAPGEYADPDVVQRVAISALIYQGKIPEETYAPV